MAKPVKTSRSRGAYRLKAVIDVGSTSIRMMVAQIYDDGSYQTIDSLYQSVAIGRDTFTGRRISHTTIEDSVKVLRNFSTVLQEYHIDLLKDVRAVATSAVREARNRIEFIDRVYMATGINVEVIEGTEVNRLTFLAIRPLLQTHSEFRKGCLLVVEVGGGSTELLGLDDGRVSFAHTYRLGSYRLRESLDAQAGSDVRQDEMLKAEIESGIRKFRESVGEERRNIDLLMMGSEARLAARLILDEQADENLMELRVSDIAKLAENATAMDTEQIASEYHLSFEEAQTLAPALQIQVRLARAFDLKKIHVCGITLRDGLLSEAALGSAWTGDFIEQILHSVKEIGKKYLNDQAHADCVTENALLLFRAMADEHGLGRRYEVVLTVAAQLHEIGTFISTSSHHKHSQYLIQNSEVFGLGEQDIKLAALVARYHRRALPRSSHLEYAALTRSERLIVNKLSAILRAVDALDRFHSQAIRKIKVLLQERQVVIEVKRSGDFAAEKRALIEKGDLFEQVYGRPIVLRTKKEQG